MIRSFIKTAILIISVTAFYKIGFGADDFTPTKLQSRFAESLKGTVSGVEDAKWKSHVDLWVQAPGADKNKAEDIASDVIAKGKTNLGESFCVHVHKGDWKEISKLCWSY
ncbi:MAG: hypothetical protein C4291_03305 [Candidatus Dadabacteria bacterium]